MEDGTNGTESIVDAALAADTGETGIEIARETLTGDLRDAALQWIRTLKKPWPALSEEDQQNVIESVTRGAAFAASRAVGIIAADKPGAVAAELEQFTAKDGLKVVLKCIENEENVVALLRAKGTRVMISSADVSHFVGERAPAMPEPDQRAIPGTEGEAAQG
jgi:hypothetical protein